MEEGKLGPQEIRLKIVLEQAGRATEAAVEFRKWVVASLMLTNSGAMIALFKTDSPATTELRPGVWLFAIGLMLAVFAGFSAFNYPTAKPGG